MLKMTGKERTQACRCRAATSRAACRTRTRTPVAPAMREAERVDRRPIPAPVQQHRALRARLQVVLLLQHDRQRERSPFAQRRHEQHAFHAEQRRRRTQKGPQQTGIHSDRGEESERGETQRENKRQGERPRGRKLNRPRGRRLTRQFGLRFSPGPGYRWTGFLATDDTHPDWVGRLF